MRLRSTASENSMSLMSVQCRATAASLKGNSSRQGDKALQSSYVQQRKCRLSVPFGARLWLTLHRLGIHPVEFSGMIQMRKSHVQSVQGEQMGIVSYQPLNWVYHIVQKCSSWFHFSFIFFSWSGIAPVTCLLFKRTKYFWRKLDLEVFPLALPQCILRDTQRCKARR